MSSKRPGRGNGFCLYVGIAGWRRGDYRSNRHFDILNENSVFRLQSATLATDYRAIFDGRRIAYGQGLVLLNNTSHDEEN